ncbi:DUF3841 domain-containing protein [Psychrobacter sp. FDAARGOS_221]|uniref:DUF3841 domain-containing protein n=1 Tax=Psychrobacter sp. FDAARGOS_221 TaxID=1975705 RepID=UPI000BB5798F|nr:DUF3841 domain-containing protein [Psychrobacter sp. FDAARGOS_221]PNK59571.1 DUF3841 domain-containing protein [Psychrobacter sp. FDAARGOS_221]
MKLWSIRTLDELDILLSGQPLRTDPDKVDKDRKQAYRWIAKQLANKVSPPQGVEYPIWVWRYWEGKHRAKPDLRAGGHVQRGCKAVRIELDISSDKVLLSDFDSWHAVLNNHHLSHTDAEYEYYEQYEAQEKDANLLKKSKEATWLKIFSIEDLPDDWAVQGVTWEILPEHIVNYKVFTGR